jgi:hypothetical protein
VIGTGKVISSEEELAYGVYYNQLWIRWWCVMAIGISILPKDYALRLSGAVMTAIVILWLALAEKKSFAYPPVTNPFCRPRISKRSLAKIYLVALIACGWFAVNDMYSWMIGELLLSVASTASLYGYNSNSTPSPSKD